MELHIDSTFFTYNNYRAADVRMLMNKQTCRWGKWIFTILHF